MKILLFIFLTIQVYAQNPYVIILGTAQDGGFPQAACMKECCKNIWVKPEKHIGVSCIALVDPISNEKWLFDATPDFSEQLYLLNKTTENNKSLDGIFLTHAHIGHYTGLMNLGREVMGATETKVYAMPKMKVFLETNNPWSQLVSLQNISLENLEDGKEMVLNSRITVMPFKVPHRDEFSETVGYKIITNTKSLIFIPDIDKWQKWNKDLKELVKENDFLLLDGTFYKDGEIARPMSEVPHPFVTETMGLLADLPQNEKEKVHFIHLNHTNPLLNIKSKETIYTLKSGFKISKSGQVINL
ncbi:pyrroloquinoline quinone biosynthesis protein PqqB [Lacihabitans sp. LS3-19]|uniref:MBL fold metallo-hydrolase n=1 Tax=Lacihabitans sp. LS3-19 TaxID=2487335 RepID=UPI0020CF4076|nr:MBL fold metallo-hydrolase [Lacihabitans sp. LS3-19]MCP9768541.1 pyrroloquinoline quinone biosynthesis protein PqqB [Lacihabitans sp. LS3-19]